MRGGESQETGCIKVARYEQLTGEVRAVQPLLEPQARPVEDVANDVFVELNRHSAAGNFIFPLSCRVPSGDHLPS